MKKKIILLIAVVFLLSTMLVACNSSGTAPAAAWAGIEILEYEVTTDNGEIIGTMESQLIRKQSSTFSNMIDDKAYDADNSFELHIDTNKVEVTTKILANGFQTVAQKKVYVDKENSDNNYTLIAYHSGNYYYSTINGEAQERIKLKDSYTESEFLYNYIRCYDTSTLPTSIKMFNSVTKTISEVGVVDSGTSKVFDVKYPKGLEVLEEDEEIEFESKSIKCEKFDITLKESPVGKPIEVYYTPDEEEYNLSSYSLDTSKRFPVCIVENDIQYNLKSIQIA